MKKLLVIAGLLFSIASQAQVGELFCGTANVFVVDDNTGPVFQFRAFFNDAAGRWAGDSTQVGDHVFVFSGNKTYKLTVDSVLSASTIVNLRVRDSTGLLASFPTGVCALMRLTDNNQYPATIPGLTNVLFSKILTYFAEKAELAMGSGSTVTTGVKGDINVVGADTDWQIMPDSVTNAKLDNMPANTIKANLTGSSANPTDATLAQIKAALGANEYCRDTITQTSHGFSKAEAIYFDGDEYVSMIGLYGDSQEPHFLVIDSTTVNTFVVAACGIVNDTLGLEEGLYYSTDTGLSVTPDTVEYPIAKVFDGKTIVMSLPGFEFDATNKNLLDIVTVSGQRTLLGGQVIPMFLDSIPRVDTICGTPVTTLLEYLVALQDCIPDSLQRSATSTGLGTPNGITHFNSAGKTTSSSNFEYRNSHVRFVFPNIGTSFTDSTGIRLLNTTAAASGLQQGSPSIVLGGFGWKTTATAASQAVNFRQIVLPIEGTTNPTGQYKIQSSVNNSAYTDRLFVTTDGVVGVGNAIVATDIVGLLSVKGTGTTLSTHALAVSNSSSVRLFRVRDDAALVIGGLGYNTFAPLIYPSDGLSNAVNSVGSHLVFRGQNNNNNNNGPVGFRFEQNFSPANSTPKIMLITGTFTNASGDAAHTTLHLTPTINHSSSGITRGIYIEPTLTLAADFRGIELSNTTHKAIFQSSTGATNYLAGNSTFGNSSTAPTAKVHLMASTATAGTASLKIVEGIRQTTGEDGTINHVSDNLEFVSGTTPYVLAKTLTNTATLDYGSIASLATETLTITVTGAAVGDVVSIGIDNASKSAGLIFGQAWVSATDTVSIEAYNSTLSPIDPASGTFRASVIKY